ncbi:MAG: prephenate dehydratase [Candidatus Omnitrophica bacterium]|nr:prephenate dehydratase [Candidatus Omnitrophota bacterium]
MSLKDSRKNIDAIDAKIISLLNDRAEISLAIGKEKVKNKKSIYAPGREKEIFKRIEILNKGPMSQEAFEAVYREVMSASLSLEKALQIAYLGPEASFTHLAAQKRFGSQVSYVPAINIAEVFQKVENGHCDYGVVPIENSIEGAVTHTFDLLVDSELKICSQILLEISHNLLSKEAKDKIKKIYSKPEVFGQCRKWLQAEMPKAELIDVSSTTRGAQIAVKEKNAACIASSLAAKVYKLRMIKKDIEDSAHNITRFLVITNNDVPPTGKDRTSILFSIKDKVGALHSMLEPFYKNKINLTKIESRPSKKKAWDYYFFVDFEGHREEKNVKKALAQLEDMCKYLKVLGSYPSLEP